jgi:hypothetical protein
MNYLVSYNHSGNTLIRYFIELMTGFPTIGHNTSCINDRFEGNLLGVDSTKEPILVKRHEVINHEIGENDNFILLLRDFKDCIKENYDIEILKYNKLLIEYSKHRGPKIVIRYNDIINNTLDVCEIILKFIKFEGKINRDIDIEYHKNKSLSVYRNKTNQPGCFKGLERLPAIQFTFELWSAASLTEFGVKLREYLVSQHVSFLREHAIGYTEGHRLSVRPKVDCMAVMFNINNKCFWTHLTRKEFNYVFNNKNC